MESTYYYARGGQKHGPFSHEQMSGLVRRGVLNRDDMVLPNNRDKWCSLGALPEFNVSEMPATAEPIEEPLPLTGTTEIPPEMPVRLREWNEIREIAGGHRWLNMWLLAAAVADYFLLGFLSSNRESPATQEILFSLGAVLAVAMIVIAVFRLARALKSNPWIYGVLTLVPVVNLLILLTLDGKSRSRLRFAGIYCGFAGTSVPKEPPDDFVASELRREIREEIERRQQRAKA